MPPWMPHAPPPCSECSLFLQWGLPPPRPGRSAGAVRSSWPLFPLRSPQATLSPNSGLVQFSLMIRLPRHIMAIGILSVPAWPLSCLFAIARIHSAQLRQQPRALLWDSRRCPGRLGRAWTSRKEETGTPAPPPGVPTPGLRSSRERAVCTSGGQRPWKFRNDLPETGTRDLDLRKQ